MTRTEEVLALMSERGGAAYFGEPVSQREHALQTAWQARQAGSPPALVAAALLHDIGHLLHSGPEDIADQGIDALHEVAGYQWVLERFGPRVAEPVRYHVAAKRYLCTRWSGYYEKLSPASVQSLALQGGPFSEEEARAFEAMECCDDAVRVRVWDDAAKIPGLAVPDLEAYRDVLEES